MACPNCSAWLVEHRFRKLLVCHHCGHEEKRPDACPNCGAEESLVAIGPGVERLQEEVLDRFPNARTLVMSSDMLGGWERVRAELGAIERGEVDIIVGTQLVAKGHNFPGLSLVGVVDADLGLSHGDPRAAERTWQLLTQVTGRAGRVGQVSRGLIQTYSPDHPVVQALVSGDREAFYATRDRDAAARASAAFRAACIDHRLRRRPAHGGGACQGDGDGRADGGGGAGSGGRPRRRSRCFAAATASGCWRSPTGRAACTTGCARGLQRAPKARGAVKVAIDIDPMSFL